MEFKLNNDGLEEYKKDPRAYIVRVRNLCWKNDIQACFEEEDDLIRLSILTPKFLQGCMIEYSTKKDRLPFILDKDELFQFDRDCPTPEEAFIRFWNVQRIDAERKPYSQAEILNVEPFKEHFEDFILQFDEWDIQAEERYWSQVSFDKAIIRSKTKSVMVSSLSNIDEAANEEQKKIVRCIPSYIQDNWKSGTLNSSENLETLKRCFQDLLKML